jgi:transformation/transcription domain-associated protein
MVSVAVQATIAPAFEVLALEAPAQKQAREDYEAMGGIWAGMAPSIKNSSAYSDFIHTQIKVCFPTFGFLRLIEEIPDAIISRFCNESSG